MKNKPGEVFEYYTLGYAIIGDIIERVIGMTVEESAQRYLFKPIGMINTTYDAEKLKEDCYILPWNYSNNKFFTEFALSAPLADRGIFSTAIDLLEFSCIFLSEGVSSNNNRIFSEASVDYMLKSITNKPYDIEHPMTPCFWMRGYDDTFGCFGDLNSAAAVGHTGFCGCMLLIDPIYKVAAVILTSSPKLHEDFRNYKLINNLIMTM